MTADGGFFRWQGGAVRLVDPIDDPIEHVRAWGHREKDRYTVPFGPSVDERDPESLHSRPWVWRYGVANNGTGASYQALATRIHADVAARLGGPIVVTLLSPWTAAYPFAAEGYLDSSYVAQKLGMDRRAHQVDVDTITQLVRILLGRNDD